ncbi:hypothetical protein SDC9_114927 [bioreactor metagenome]|uniref:Uncharacterized protein n=1 Tax=bioreactor metagenome TaxID=1076179 RepID=A0A645BTP9_9ZZZZ
MAAVLAKNQQITAVLMPQTSPAVTQTSLVLARLDSTAKRNAGITMASNALKMVDASTTLWRSQEADNETVSPSTSASRPTVTVAMRESFTCPISERAGLK